MDVRRSARDDPRMTTPRVLPRSAKRCGSRAPISPRTAAFALLASLLGACAALPSRDPLVIDVANIEPLPGAGMELNLAVSIRIQNPNDLPLDYSGAAFTLDVNGRRLASGVSDLVGTVPRYGERIITIPVTISAFNAARQIVGFMTANEPDIVSYSLRGKLEGGVLGTRRFSDEGTFTLRPAAAP
jgi:hypothetical protein